MTNSMFLHTKLCYFEQKASQIEFKFLLNAEVKLHTNNENMMQHRSNNNNQKM